MNATSKDATQTTAPPTILQRLANAGTRAPFLSAAGIAECIDSYGDLIWSLCLRLTASKSEAEAVSQAIFLDLQAHADEFDPADGSEIVFVTLRARRVLIDRLDGGQRSVHQRALPENIAAMAARTSVNEYAAHTVCREAGLATQAFTRLGGDAQTILKLSLLLGLNHEQIAQAVDIPTATVKTQLCRSLLAVRQHIAQLQEHDFDQDMPA